MAERFDANFPTIFKHMKNIYTEQKLERDSTVSKMETIHYICRNHSRTIRISRFQYSSGTINSQCTMLAPPSEMRIYVMYKTEPLPKEKHTNEELYRRQVETLKLFLSKHAITQAQFDKSYRDLTEKMHITKSANSA